MIFSFSEFKEMIVKTFYKDSLTNIQKILGKDMNLQKTEELFLGDGCTLLIGVNSGYVSGSAFVRIWVEVGIKNRDLLPEFFSQLKSAIGIEESYKLNNNSEFETLHEKLVTKALEMIKNRIWPF